MIKLNQPDKNIIEFSSFLHSRNIDLKEYNTKKTKENIAIWFRVLKMLPKINPMNTSLCLSLSYLNESTTIKRTK